MYIPRQLGAVAACQEMVELITDYLEDALSRRDRRGFERHLVGCEHCTEYLAQMRHMLSLADQLLVPEDLSPEIRHEFANIYRKWQHEQ
jgi:anti-sigma factor RsiW